MGKVFLRGGDYSIMIRLFVLLAFSLILLYTPISYSESPTFQSILADKINNYRNSNGLDSWKYDVEIESVIDEHIKTLAETNTFSHKTPFTNIDSNLRGSLNGFSLCGDSQTIKDFKLLNQRLFEYNNGLYSDFDSIEKLAYSVQNDMNQEKLYIGLVENLSEVNSTNIQDKELLAESVFQGWLESPKHNEALLGHNEKVGISLILDSDMNRVLVGMNAC